MQRPSIHKIVDQATALWEKVRSGDQMDSHSRIQEIADLVDQAWRAAEATCEVMEEETAQAKRRVNELTALLRLIAQDESARCIVCNVDPGKTHRNDCAIGKAVAKTWTPGKKGK